MSDPTLPDPGAPRREAELARRLAEVEARIGAACAAAGRPRTDVTLVAVTKFFPAADAAALVRLGVAHLGESRDQEAGPKSDAVERLLDGAQGADGTDAPMGRRPAWHFIGQLQTNKAAHVARYADVVETVDRDRLVEALARGAERAGRTIEILLQVGLGGPDADRRGGADPADLPALADLVAARPSLRLRGVMAVAPRGLDPRPAFDELVAVGARLQATHPDAWWVSGGMSADLEAAVAAGTTHLRIGSAILGARAAAG